MKIDQSNITLYNDDCLKVLKNIKNDSIECCITDPPYGIGFANTHSNEKFKWDKKTKQEFVEFTSIWLNEINRVLTPTGTCWMFFGPTMIEEVQEAIRGTTFTNHYENWIIMARNKGRGAKNKLKSIREDVFHLTKHKTDYVWHSEEYLRRVIAPYKLAGGIKRGWDYKDGVPMRFTGLGNIMFSSDYELKKGEKPRGWIPDISTGEPLIFDGDPSDVVFFTPPSYHNKFEPQQHSTQKSILLLTMLTMLSSDKGNTIIDPFMGSGSEAIASICSERNFIGIEQEKETFDKAENWIKNINYKELSNYFKEHISSSESNFKFGFSERKFMKKTK